MRDPVASGDDATRCDLRDTHVGDVCALAQLWLVLQHTKQPGVGWVRCLVAHPSGSKPHEVVLLSDVHVGLGGYPAWDGIERSKGPCRHRLSPLATRGPEPAR